MGRRVLIISDAGIGGRARVEREASVFEQLGWEIAVTGTPNAHRTPARWSCIPLPGPINHPLTKWDVPALVSGRLTPAAGARAFWKVGKHRSLFSHLTGTKADLIVAHNAVSLPHGIELGRTLGVPVALDLHEYPVGEYREHTLWRLLVAPYVRAYLDHYLPKACLVTAVSQGIADQIGEDHALDATPTTIRSFAGYEKMPLREPGARIQVLYHGVIHRHRSLDRVIDSMPEWNEDVDFTIRGRCNSEEYLASLRDRAEQRGVADRVRFEDAVPRGDVVRAANRHDIGLFITGGDSPQRRFVLPNKLFEYIMAGLAVCVTDMPEMARIVREHEVGVLVPESPAKALPEAINQLTRERIVEFKRRSLIAARTLCWEQEQKNLTAAYARVGVPID